MTQAPKVPMSLKLVAGLFLLEGAWALTEMVATRSIRMDLGILGLLVGMGLLRLIRGWRMVALVLLALTMVSALVLMALTLSGTDIAGSQVRILGEAVQSKLLATMFLAAFLAIKAGQLWVLTRPGVSVLFSRR